MTKNSVSLLKMAASRLRGRSYPFVTVLRLNDACNQSCAYCDSPKLKGNLDFARLEPFLNRVYGQGCRFFILTGGEPFLYPARKELMRWFDSRSAYLIINTNGKGVGKRDYDSFLCSADEVLTSLDGLEVYNDQVRGAGTHRNVLNLLALLNSNGIKATLSVVLTAGNTNYENLRHILDLKTRYHANLVLSPVTGQGRINNDAFSTHNSLRDSHFRDLKTFIASNRRELSEIPDHLINYFENPTPFTCQTFKYAVYVDVSHKIFPCINVTDREDACLGDLSTYTGSLNRKISCNACHCPPLITGNLLLGFRLPRASYLYGILRRFLRAPT